MNFKHHRTDRGPLPAGKASILRTLIGAVVMIAVRFDELRGDR